MDEDLQRLQGTWQAVRIETEAGPIPAEVAGQLRYVFEGDRVTLFEGEQATGTGTFAVDTAQDPKAIDVEMVDGPGSGQVARGIYEVDGPRLRLCIGLDRPAGFLPAGTASLVEMERADAGERPA
jgi:uncharacterized protein (TIGR03067 family)